MEGGVGEGKAFGGWGGGESKGPEEEDGGVGGLVQDRPVKEEEKRKGGSGVEGERNEVES